MNDDARRAIAAVAALAVGSTLLKRSRVLRLGVAGVVAVAAYSRLVRREPTWHDVEPPP